eukprot:gene3217-5533_t
MKIVQNLKKNFSGNKNEKRTILKGEPYTSKKSKFIAHISEIDSLSDVNLVLNQLKEDKKILKATHNIFAFRFLDSAGNIHEKNEDDGESGASEQLLFLLQKNQLKHHIVIVTRWYGNIHLGSERFKIISKLAKELIEKIKK